jgi:UDPglucose--hexose-1-phosphate uridylyltransferase
MSELRQNLITRDWVIIATERAKRPDEFTQHNKQVTQSPAYQPHCPFCLGNEDASEVELFCLGDRHQWKVRSVLNKFPALSPVGESNIKVEGIYRSMNGFGIHEVVIEHPYHNVTTGILDVNDVANILRAYRQRYAEIRQDPRIKTITIFKNHGERAGTSLEHPHSQIAATPVVPPQIRNRIAEAIQFIDDTGECLFCRTLKDELADPKRVVVESEHFVAFIPYAALSAFHTWIFPRRHTSSFDDINDAEILDLAYTLKTVLAKLYYGLNNPDYNYTIRSLPTNEKSTDYFHWYIAIVPRLSYTAGFELGCGMYINTVTPEDSAEFLRGVQTPQSPVCTNEEG